VTVGVPSEQLSRVTRDSSNAGTTVIVPQLAIPSVLVG